MWIFLLIVTSSIGEYFAFYRLDKLYNSTISAFGKALIEYSYENGVFKQGYWSCDGGLAWPMYQCDVFFWQRPIVVGIVDWKVHDRMCREILDHLITLEENVKYWEKFGYFYGKSKYYGTYTDVTYLNFVDPLYYDSDKYLKITGVCANFRDRGNFWITYSRYIYDFCGFSYFIKPGVMQHIESGTKYWTWVRYYMKPSCRQNYYEPSCWKKCIPVNDRLICSNLGEEICIGHFDHYLFNYTYLIHKKYLEDDYEAKTIKHCLFYDACFYKPSTWLKCPEDEQLCYPTDNGTYTCVIFRLFYMVSKYSKFYNATFNSLLNTEDVTITKRFRDGLSELMDNHTTCSWMINRSYPQNKLLGTSDFGYRFMYPRYIKYGKYSVYIDCLIGYYRRFLYFKNYTIHILPEVFGLFNTSLGDSVSIFIGQIIRCQTDAIPQNISQHHLYLLTKNFPEINTDRSIMEIPLTAKLGFCIIQCIHSFIFPDRRPYNTSHMFKRDIRSYVYFTWIRHFKNVYTIDEFAGCISLTYFVGLMKIKIVIQASPMNLMPYSNFSTFATAGGQFHYLCFLYNDAKMYFVKSLSFELFFMPTLMCLLPYFATPGTTFFVSHNGYPEDHASYWISIYIENILISSSTVNYIRLPFVMPLKVISIEVKIVFFLTERATAFSFITETMVEYGTKKTAKFPLENFECAKYSETEIEASQEEGTTLTFFSYLLYLTDPYYVPAEILFGTVFIVFFLIIMFLVITRRKAKSLDVKEIRRGIKMRAFNDLLSKKMMTSSAEREFDRVFKLNEGLLISDDDV